MKESSDLKRAQLDVELSNAQMNEAFDHLKQKTQVTLGRFRQMVDQAKYARTQLDPRNNGFVALTSLAAVAGLSGWATKRVYEKIAPRRSELTFEIEPELEARSGADLEFEVTPDLEEQVLHPGARHLSEL